LRSYDEAGFFFSNEDVDGCGTGFFSYDKTDFFFPNNFVQIPLFLVLSTALVTGSTEE